MRFQIIIWGTVTLLVSCTNHYIPKTGDLLFQDLDCGELCDAIEKVTTGIDGADFSHVGIVSVEKDTAFVYEAIDQGIVRTRLDKFLERSKDSAGKPKVMAGRVKKEYEGSIPGAIKLCRKIIGKPYDDVFDLQNQSYYCSELVYFAFMDAGGKNLFETAPMTFKDPDTGKTFPAWDDYYKNLNAAIPEGKPGLNPGGVSRSPVINIVYRFY